jgi:RNA polymerase sigma-70 factor (ECF subfamily)
LFRSHGRDVLAYALRRTDRATAEEIVSDVFLVAMRRLQRIPDDEPVLWLYGVARRLLANERRAARRRSALGDALRDVSPGELPAAPSGSPVLEALATLRPEDRELLMLIAWEGLTPAQAARVLGCSAPALHTRLHRARKRLSPALDVAAPARTPTEVPAP